MNTTTTNDPHTNSRKNPIVLQQSIERDEAVYSLKIPYDLSYFDGHFPTYPILPAVVQIKWVMDISRRIQLPFTSSEKFSAMTKLKFVRPIKPGSLVTLHLTICSMDKTMGFRYFDDKGDYSSGLLNFM